MKWRVMPPIRFLKTARGNFFLKKQELNPVTLELLRTIYPSVDWKRVDFYEGLPWFTPVVAPYVNAQALPQFYSFSRFSIYLRKFDESRAQCVADVVHEAFHVMQAMQFARGYGIGFLRGWLIYYIAHFLAEGYRHNVFETPAYDQEFRFLQACVKHKIAGVVPKVEPRKLLNVLNEKSLVFETFEYNRAARYLLLPVSAVICLVVCGLKPLADVLIYLLTFPARKKGPTTPRP